MAGGLRPWTMIAAVRSICRTTTRSRSAPTSGGDMKDFRLDAITAALDLVSTIAAPVFGAYLVEQFGDRRGVNAVWPLLGWICFCGAIWLVRRLQPAGEQNPMAPDPSITKPASWLGMSTIVGTVLLLTAMAYVSGEGVGAVF